MWEWLHVLLLILGRPPSELASLTLAL